MFWSIPVGYSPLAVGRGQLPRNGTTSLLEAPHKVSGTASWEQTRTCRAILRPRLSQSVSGVLETCCAFCLGGVLPRVCSQMSESTTYT